MNIAKIFLQSLGVTSQVKTFLMVCHFQTDSRSNEFGIHWTARAIRSKKRMSCVRMTWAIFLQKMSSVWMACAIRLNGLGYTIHLKKSRDNVSISLFILLQVMLSSWLQWEKSKVIFHMHFICVWLRTCSTISPWL